MRPSILWPALSVAATPLLLAILGVTHPRILTPETAPYWHALHLVLLVVFPLLGVNLWWLLSSFRDVASWAVRVLAFVYIVFYGALDVLAGIGTGLLVMRQLGENSPELSRAVELLFAQGSTLSFVGVGAFLIACVLTSVILLRRVGLTALPGAIVLCGSAVPFLVSHIYYPVGVLTMAVMALGFALLMGARRRWERLPPERTVRTKAAA